MSPHARDTTLHALRIRSTDHERELSRRQFMQLVTASAAAAMASGCQPNPPEKIMPYVRQPLDVTPGVPAHYATSWLLDGYATGLIVETRAGRPIKVEGNPAHPASLGATSAFHQAAVLQLYDPDRARTALQRGLPASTAKLVTQLSAARSDQGRGLAVLLQPTSSALVHAQVQALKSRYPECRVTWYSPTQAQYAMQVSRALFGRDLSAQLDLSVPDVIAAFDSRPLDSPYNLQYPRAFAARRHVSAPDADMNRLYVAEPALSVTGAMADHRLRRTAQRVGLLVAALGARVLPQSSLPADQTRAVWSRLDAQEQRFIEVLARDLRQRARGHSLVIAGDRQPAAVQVLCHSMNAQLGNVGGSVHYTQPAVPYGHGDRDLAALVDAMHSGAVDTLLICGANPAYDAPADLAFSRALQKVENSYCTGLYYNETAEQCRFFLPHSHPFESWGDGRAHDGTYSLVQPLIRPMFATTTTSALLSELAQLPQVDVDDRVRLRVRFGRERGEPIDLSMSQSERDARRDRDVQVAFESALARGLVSGSAFAPVNVQMNTTAAAQALRSIAAQPSSEQALEINFIPSPTLHDGAYANVSWLLELPEPTTKLTWDNAALMSPQTARKLGIAEAEIGDDDMYPVVELRRAGRVLRAPVLSLPSHADDCVTLWLGYGRQGSERLAHGAGVNAYTLRTRDAQYFSGDLHVHPLQERYPLAITQLHRVQHDRPLALSTTLRQYQKRPDLAAELKGPLPSFLPDYPAFQPPGPQWAMTIDMSMCNGCSACMVACQAENNLMVVGKDQVRRGRGMYWIRIDLYEQQGDATRLVSQPMPCQHCENAPCEYVCPVNATEHSPDGLNEMIYNRCVGTRFCSNNCPYKVRRFNWFNWQDHTEANRGSVMLQRNPEVSVRERGVMEKCSYCVQRIRAAEIEARKERREIRTGEVRTACQQACPTAAIRFGSLTDPHDPMRSWRQQPRCYSVLHETGARPRTQYLARIDNPNEELT